MAALRRRTFRRRTPVYWDVSGLKKNQLPNLVLDELTAVQGAQTAIKRYNSGGDRTIRRSIGACTGSIVQLANQTDPDAVLSLCIGLSVGDSTADLNGQAVNSEMGLGTGPLTDADSSAWMIRCCIQIPIGMADEWSVNQENLVFSPTPTSQWWAFGGASGAEIPMGFSCSWDTKQMRRMRGKDTPWLNVAMEAEIDPTPDAGTDISINLNGFSNRWVVQLSK